MGPGAPLAIGRTPAHGSGLETGPGPIYGEAMGPLEGIKIIELAGIGPAPFCAMMLADMGADVIRVDRAVGVRGGDPAAPPKDALTRNRRSIGVDLKNADGVEAVLKMVESADGLIEGQLSLSRL